MKAIQQSRQKHFYPIESTVNLTAEQEAAIENAFTIAENNFTNSGGTINWTYEINGSEISYLELNETVKAIFTVVTDQKGAAATENVTITLTGGGKQCSCNPWGPTSISLNETDAVLTTAGSLTVTDADTADFVTISNQSLAITGTSNRNDPVAPSRADLENMLTVTPSTVLDGSTNTATLNWSFNSNGEKFDYLADGETLILQYTIEISDGSLNAKTKL